MWRGDATTAVQVHESQQLTRDNPRNMQEARLAATLFVLRQPKHCHSSEALPGSRMRGESSARREMTQPLRPDDSPTISAGVVVIAEAEQEFTATVRVRSRQRAWRGRRHWPLSAQQPNAQLTQVAPEYRKAVTTLVFSSATKMSPAGFSASARGPESPDTNVFVLLTASPLGLNVI